MRRGIVTMCWVLGYLLVACGGDDGKKARTTCTDDAVCGGGICFEQECYEACSATDPCADDELCVRKEKAGAEVDLCVVAAEFDAVCTTEEDCRDLIGGPCAMPACHESACALLPLPDGQPCYGANGQPDVCTAGVCGQASTDACDDPSGTWKTSVAHPENQSTAPCIVDGMVTQQITMILAKGADGGYTMTIETTNNVNYDTDTCFTYSEEWPGGVLEDGVMSLTKQTQEEKDCGNGPTTVTTTFGFEGTLNADCTQISGTSWKEPADSCNPDSGRYDIPGVTFTKVTSGTAAAFQ